MNPSQGKTAFELLQQTPEARLADLIFEFEPFYVGKGKGRRFERTYKEAIANRGTKHRHNKIRSIVKHGLEPIIIKVFKDISEQEAFAKEVELIEAFKPYLTNLTNGGDGSSGHVKTEESKHKASVTCKKIWTEEKKKEQSEKMKAISNPEDVKRRVELRKSRGTDLHTNETKQLIKDKLKEKWQNPLFRAKVIANRAKAHSEGRGKRKSQYTKEQLRERANIAKRKRRAERKNKS
jgi:hypothetical protein